MDILFGLLRLIAAIAIAFTAGRLISKLRLPDILGWLIAGMIMGPHALKLLSQPIIDSGWFSSVESLFECVFGLMIGTEMVFGKMKKSGPQILVTTLTESLGTFIVVSAVFAAVFYFSGVPVYLAFVLGSIALATAPAPSLSVVNSFRTEGPVTRTLIPMAALDDMVGGIVFFLVIVMVAAGTFNGGVPIGLVLLVVLLPLVLGAVMGAASGLIMRKMTDRRKVSAVMLIMLVLAWGAGALVNSVLPAPVINFMLIGLSYSSVFANIISRKQLNELNDVMHPVIGFAMIVVILNLAVPLDYHLIFGAGAYTAVYIVSRAIGKYGGAYFGSAVTHAPETVKKYLGFTLLPHSGVSLVFTGIAVSVLSATAPECAGIVQGTIAAAAVINEIIAVFMAKKGFEWAGELGRAGRASDK